MEYSPKLAALLLLALASATMAMTQNSAEDMVDAHNAAREVVGVGPVSWDPTVAAWAEAYAEQRRADCQLVHSPEGRPYGENLFWGSGADWKGVDAVTVWVTEKLTYDHDSNSCSALPDESCEHYTQVVWKDSTAIGCARVLCDGGAGVFIICSYNPPGNIVGQPPY